MSVDRNGISVRPRERAILILQESAACGLSWSSHDSGQSLAARLVGAMDPRVAFVSSCVTAVGYIPWQKTKIPNEVKSTIDIAT